jgi:hypothetical protein
MDRCGGPHTHLTMALNVGLYLAKIMDRYGVPHTALSIALHGDLYLPIKMDHNGGGPLL